MTAIYLAREYGANEARADSKYKGKKLTVIGTVKGIEKGLFDQTHITLYATPNTTSYSLVSVTAKLQKSEELKAIELNKGQSIRLRCVGAGEVLGDPILRECTIN